MTKEMFLTEQDQASLQDQADLQAGRELWEASADNLVAAAHLSCLVLIRQALRLNAQRSEYIESGVRMDGQPVGDWKVTVEQIEAIEQTQAEEAVTP